MKKDDELTDRLESENVEEWIEEQIAQRLEEAVTQRLEEAKRVAGEQAVKKYKAKVARILEAAELSDA